MITIDMRMIHLCQTENWRMSIHIVMSRFDTSTRTSRMRITFTGTEGSCRPVAGSRQVLETGGGKGGTRTPP
jgi:hypothetical protein